jgi:hypothetical protein
MTKKPAILLSIGAFILLFGLFSPALAQEKSDEVLANETMRTYFDLIATANYESALDLWEPSAIARSERLGIAYEGIPIRPDCGSPAIYDRERIGPLLYSNVFFNRVVDSGIMKVDIRLLVEGENVERAYFMRKSGQYFWFIFPQDYYAKDWPIIESKYFRFHVNPNVQAVYNTIAAQSLDNFVDKIAAKIFIPADRMTVLATEKIDYYLCESDNEVDKITGRATKGVYDKGSDAIISAIFPHFHEVAGLLVNFKLQKLPLFALPFIQEGLAIYLGGRWQRAPEVMLDFGEYILDYKIVELDSALGDKSDPNTVAADISYPVDACLTEYLFQDMGGEGFFALYRALSGDYKFYRHANLDTIKTILQSHCGKSYEQIKAAFESFIKSQESRGGLVFPGDVPTDRELVNDGGLIISSSEKWLKVEYFSKPDEKVDVNFLFRKDPSMKDKISLIFLEQYKDSAPFEGYRYGVKMDRNELGLYDYFTNQLIAKYVHDFDPGPGYYDSATGKFSAYFDIGLLNGALPEKEDYKIVK